MICKADGTYEIEQSDIDKVNKWVYKLLNTRATSGSRTFNLDAFVKYIYDRSLEKTNDAQKALTITRQVPIAIDLVISADPNLRKGLAALQGYSRDAVDAMGDSFAESITAVSDFISEYNKPKNLANTLGASVDANFSQPDSAILAAAYNADEEESTDLPYSPLTTTGNEGIESRAWYYGFIKNLADISSDLGGMNIDGTASYRDVPGGVRITMMMGTQIPVNQLYEDIQAEPNIEISKNNQIFSVVTDAKGNIVYFDENYNVTDAENGKLVYFPVRAIPSYKMDGTRKVFNLREQSNKSVQSIEDKARKIVKANPLIKLDDAIAQVEFEYQNSYRLLSDAVEYLKANPSETIPLNLTGVNKGTLRFNKDIETKLGSIKNLGSLDIDFKTVKTSADPGGKNLIRKYLSISKISDKIPLSMVAFSMNDAIKVGTFLANDIYTDNGVLLSTKDKYEIIKTFVPLGTEGLYVDKDNGEIRLGGEPVSLEDKEVAAKAIADFLTREISTKDSKGNDVKIKNQYWFSKESYEDPNGTINNFNLTNNGDGTYNLNNNFVNYRNWLRENAYTKIELDSNGNISQVNGYFEFALSPESQKKISQKETPQMKAPKSEGELSIDNLTAPTVEDKIAALSEIRKRAEGRGKKGLFSMRHESLAANKAQIKRGKKWFDTTKVTFKDADGKIVTKALSDIMPYNELFNVINSRGDVRAVWTRNGIVLYNGSDYTDLYHEAWHGFTQFFLTGEQKQTLYNEVKKLKETLRYYNHDLGKWETMNSKDLDFTNRDHIIYAEEYLAEKFRKYAIDRSAPNVKVKSIFRKIWEALKALFGTSPKETAANPYENNLINTAFDQLYTGNLVDYTFDQANVQFGKLNFGITAVDSELSGGVEGLDLPDSIAMAEGINSYVSEFIDFAVKGDVYGNADPGYASLIMTDSEYKKDALYYAVSQMEAQYKKLENSLDGATTYERQIIRRRMNALRFSIDQFGDIEALEANNKGTLAFFNKRTGFLDLTLRKTEDDTTDIGDETDESGPNVNLEGKGRDGISSGNGTEFSAVDRMDSVIAFAFSNIIKRDADGISLNRMGLPVTADKRDIYNIVVSVVENMNSRDEMYTALWEKSQEKDKGKPTPEALMIGQFLARVGEPDPNSTGVAQLFWNKLFHAVRFDRLTGLQVNINKRDDGNFDVIVGETDSSDTAIKRDWIDTFVYNNPSDFFITDPKTNESYLDLKALKEKYKEIDMSKLNIYEFLKDFGIKITPLSKHFKAIRESGIIEKLINFRINPLLQSKDIKISTLSDLLEKEYTVNGKVVEGQAGQLKKLLKLETLVNPTYTDYMRLFGGDARSERSNPSGPGNVLIALNNANNFNEIISRPELSQYNPDKNPAVKTSVILTNMFENLSGRNKKISIAYQTLLGTQLLEKNKEIDDLIASIPSAQSDEQVAYLRDFFAYALNGAGEAFKHADKNIAYIAQMVGDTRYYIAPKDFSIGAGVDNKGRKAANRIITGYIGSELERIKKVIKSNEGKIVSGEKASDIILYADKPVEENGVIKEMKYVTLADVGTDFAIFDDILLPDLKNELINNENIQTVEDFLELLSKDKALEERIHAQLNDYFNKLVKEDREKLISYQLFNGPKNAGNALKNIKSRSFDKAKTDRQVFEASVLHFVYSSFIHKHEMLTLFYGDPVMANHDKDEHMKRIPTFFATGRIPVSDDVMENWLQKNPGGYYASNFFKESGLQAPADNKLVSRYLKTAVLEDAIESISEDAFNQMVEAYVASERGDEKEAARKYRAYKNMKSADGQGWISFDAYRALEIRLDNWGPAKEAMYHAVLRGEETDPEKLDLFFPVKKMQYAGPVGTKNFAANAVHKYSLMPLIPTVIKGTELEKLHNKMVSQNVGYAVMHSGSKVASIGTNKKLNKFYTEPNGDHTLAFTSPDYEFVANTLYLEYFKEQLVTHDTQKGKVKFPTQRRSLVGLGLMDGGVPSDFEPNASADERLAAWNSIGSEKERLKLSKNYRLRQNYLDSFKNLFDVAVSKLKMELGYKDPKSTSKQESLNVAKLMNYIQEQFTDRETLNEYQLDFLQIGPKGELVFPQDLGADPAQIEKLIASLVNKRISDQMSKGESFIQVSGVGFRKANLRTGSDLLFYRIGPNGETLPMQVKIPLIGDFKNLLNHVDKDGKKIGTITRLNELIKDEEWLNTGDNRKMITMGGDRIPIQGVNSMEVMEVAEFLDPAGGNMMVLPLEIVAKTGGDFDIDKLICLIPVIKNNMGLVELSKPVKNRKLLKTIIDEKATLRDELKALRKQYIKGQLQPEFREAINELEEQQRAAQEEFNQNYVNQYYVGGSLDKYFNRIDNLQKEIDALYEQLAEEKVEVYEGKFDKYIAEAESIQNKLRELNRQQDSFSPEAYQNNLMQSMNDILLRGDNFTNLTLPNDTDIFTEKGGPVDILTSVNRPYNRSMHKTASKRKKMSPTKIMENGYNNQKAFAINAGKNGISIAAKTNKIFALYKEIGLYMQPTYTKNNTTIEQRLLVDHNFLTIGGKKVISVGNSKDVEGRDISDTISQLMNGYLDVAKEDWVFDINAIKELEPEFLFLVEAGAGALMPGAILSQPLVKRYVDEIRKTNNAFSLAVSESAESLSFAKYNALLQILNDYVPDLFKFEDRRIGDDGTPINPSIMSLVKGAQEMLGENPENFQLDDLISNATKSNKSVSEYDVKVFLHFMEIMELTKGDQELKSNIDIDTKQQLTAADAVAKINGLRDLSAKFPKAKINELINNTYLSNFNTEDEGKNIMLEAISAVLPLRGLDSVNQFIYQLSKSLNFEDKRARENFMRNFINELPLYISANRKPKAVAGETSYKGYELDTEIAKQTLLYFGAFYDSANQVLLVDHDQIDKDFDSRAYSKEGYGGEKNLLALLPPSTFSSYLNRKAARGLYRAFVYERELARHNYPFEGIESDAEFLMFKTMRLESAKSKISDAAIYEEFLRNKGLYNAGIDVGKFESIPSMGIFSMADTMMHIIKTQPSLKRDFSILNKLKVQTIGTKSFIALIRKIKDVDVQSASIAELMDLMNPAIAKSGNSSLNLAISSFFAKFPEMAFAQAGNNSASGLYLGSIVDPKYVAVAQADNLKEYIEALQDPKYSERILKDFSSKFQMKAPYRNKFSYYNYNSNLDISDFEAPASEYPIADEIYPQMGEITKSENVILPEDLNENTVYEGKNFWDKIVPEAKTMFDDKLNRETGKIVTMLIAFRGNRKKTFLQNYKDGKSVGNPFDWQVESGNRTEQGTKSTKKFTEWMITGNNFGVPEATEEYRQAIIDDIKSGAIVGSPILYYQEKNYATHATALDYLINKYDWNTETPVEVKTISEPYGVVIAETNPTEAKTQEFVNLIKPQIQAQAYKENASGTANDMFMYGLRWTRKNTARVPLVNKSYANGGLLTTDAKAKDGYVYDTVDQNGNPLAPVSDLQPIMEEIEKTLGIDMSNYDAVIGNIYLPGQKIATHRDTTESLSARNYPVVVYTIGNMSGISIYENEKNPGSASFASDKRTTIPTQNGSIYTFGMDGKGRFEMAHDTPGMKREQKFPPITLPNGTVVENYTVTLTFRRAADLEPGMPTSPAKLSTPSAVEGPGPETSINVYSTDKNGYEDLSNFAIRPFTHLGIKFDSVEQAYQFYKSEFSPKNEHNRAVASVIKDTTNGKRLRELGREFKGLDNDTWDKMNSTIMRALLKDSFEQNPDALAKLLATGNATLTHTQDRSKWKTEFPRLLMEVRNELRPNKAPVTSKAAAKVVDTVTPSGLIMNMRGPKELVDYETGDTFEVAKVYNQNKFIQKNDEGVEVAYKLSEQEAKAIMDANPDAVFVFGNYRPNAEGKENPSSGNATRRAWRSGLATGQSFGFGTKTFKGTTPTDEQFENIKKAVDEQTQELIAMRNAGKTIVFPSDGIGQNFLTVAPQSFVYLSKQLLENFGYRNPSFEKVSLILEPTGQTGLDYIQEFYKGKADAESGELAQTVSDKEVIEQIKFCKINTQ